MQIEKAIDLLNNSEKELSKIIYSFIDDGFLDEFLNKEQQQEFIKIMDYFLDINIQNKIKNIKRFSLNSKKPYFPFFHGLHHSQKVCLFSYILGVLNNLSADEIKIVTDASLFHDLGRIDDNEDATHGLTSANYVEKIIKSDFYKDDVKLRMVKALCDFHSQPDNRLEIILITYDLEEYKDTFIVLACILKDADALDRTRFNKTIKAALNDRYLRFSESQKMVDFAKKINQYYRNKISKYFLQIHKERMEINLNLECKHGIGFNFFALEKILSQGLLSNFSKNSTSRNFNGRNGDLWISATVDYKTDDEGKTCAREKFVDNGISFNLRVPFLEDGITDQTLAMSTGLPHKSGEYFDEVFIFYKVPVENIIGINLDSFYFDKKLTELNYLNCSNNYETLECVVNSYLEDIRLNGYFPDISKLNYLLMKYRFLVLDFEQKSNYEQQQTYQKLYVETDKIKQEIDIEIGKYMQQLFNNLLGKEVTVIDVVNSILMKLNICYNVEGKRKELKL